MPTGITIVKSFTYRGQPEEWSNTYWLTGGTPPSDNAAWLALCTAVATSERVCYPSNHKIVRYYGYTAPGTKSAFQYDFVALGQTTLPGTLMATDGSTPAGDQAAQIRALCGQASTGRNKYLRKYFHGPLTGGSSAPDAVSPASITALGTHATKLTDGSLTGGWKWCNEAGAVGTFPYVPRFITTRTLKRRGKRPS